MAVIEGLAAFAALGGLYGLAVEPRRLVLRPHRLPWPGSYGDGRPMRIAVLADIHAAWPHMTPARIARVAGRILSARPSLVLLAGDFATTETWGVLPVAPEKTAAALAALARRVPTFAVLGNHDYDYDGERVAGALRGVGIRVLVNEALPVEVAGSRIWLAGLDDPVTLRHDFEATFAALPASEPAILLSHTPDVHAFAPDNVRLIVAGHTHGGQVCLPGFGPVITMSRLPRHQAHGLHQIGGRHLFVTGGIGTSGLPVRFLRPPEVGLLELIPAETWQASAVSAASVRRLPSRRLQPAD